MATSLPCRPRARRRVGPGCLPQSRYAATCCLLIAAVLVTQYPGQFGLLDRDPGNSPTSGMTAQIARDSIAANDDS
jgi:hypothetical protein